MVSSLWLPPAVLHTLTLAESVDGHHGGMRSYISSLKKSIQTTPNSKHEDSRPPKTSPGKTVSTSTFLRLIAKELGIEKNLALIQKQARNNKWLGSCCYTWLSGHMQYTGITFLSREYEGCCALRSTALFGDFVVPNYLVIVAVAGSLIGEAATCCQQSRL